ncbi:hypothetical protein D3C85_873730 [compost metagenome]
MAQGQAHHAGTLQPPRHHPWQQDHALARGHQGGEKVRLAAAAAFFGGEAHFQAGLQQAVVQHETALVKQEGCIGQLRQVHLLPARQGVVGRQQYIQGFVAKRLEAERRVDRCQAATQFQFAIEHRLLDAQAAAFDQLHADVRVASPVFGE